ncbi:glycoside hydrolase family protein [Salix suchowensis]|nr:glycoside hydrolase family protein [Salix suchowensis]
MTSLMIHDITDGMKTGQNSTRFSRSAQISCFSTLRLFRLKWISLLVRDPRDSYSPLPPSSSLILTGVHPLRSGGTSHFYRPHAYKLRDDFLLLCAVSCRISFTVGALGCHRSGATWTDTSGNVIQAHGGGFLKVGSTWYWHGEDKAHNSALFRAVSCYTSNNLVDWSRQNDALTPVSGTMISTSNIVERPKGARTAYLLYASDNNQNFKISRLDADYYNIAAQVNTIPDPLLRHLVLSNARCILSVRLSYVRMGSQP